MRFAIMAVAALGALSLAACESKADKTAEATADAVKADANVTATNIDNQADAAKDAGAAPSTVDAMHDQADQVKKDADAKGDAIEKQAGKKD